MKRQLRGWITGVVILALAALACNAPGLRGGAALPQPEATPATPIIDPTLLTPAPTEEVESTPSPTQPAEAIPSPTGCGYWAEFVDDVTVPDGLQFAPGEPFEKTWRFRNNGCLDWPEGTQMIFWGGDQMGGPDAVDVPPTTFNELVDITVPLTAPREPGSYTGYWQIRAPDGAGVGPYVYVQIEVVEANGDAQPGGGDTPGGAGIALASTWVNQDVQDGDIARLQARVVGDRIVVHRWDQCGTSLCDRGEQSTSVADASDNVLTLTWRIEGQGELARTETLQAALLLDKRLQVTGTVNYDDPAQADTTFTEYFVQE